MKEYRRSASGHGILEICKRPDLARYRYAAPVENRSMWTPPQSSPTCCCPWNPWV